LSENEIGEEHGERVYPALDPAAAEGTTAELLDQDRGERSILLSLDERIRTSAREFGFEVVPG